MARVTKNDILELIPQLDDESIDFQKIADEMFAHFLSNYETAALESMLSKGMIKPTSGHFEKVISAGKCDIVKLLLQFTAQPQNALKIAITHKQSEIIKLLLVDKRYDIDYCYEYKETLIETLCRYGDVELVKIALTDEQIDPARYRNFPIQIAAKAGKIEIIKYLMTDVRVNPGDDNNYALEYAINSNKLEAVKLLLTDVRVTASLNDNKALMKAFKINNTEMVKALIPYSDLTKISDITILNLAKEMLPPPSIWNAFTELMKQYNVKSINIETGKQFSVQYNQ